LVKGFKEGLGGSSKVKRTILLVIGGRMSWHKPKVWGKY
jgi:hypothetical protein